jgi:hypothetical protein
VAEAAEVPVAQAAQEEWVPAAMAALDINQA